MKKTCAIIAAIALALAWPAAALAESYIGATGLDDGRLPAALKGDTEIERLTVAAQDAQKNLDEAAAEAAKIQGEIDAVERELPVQEARGATGARQLYAIQNDPLSVIEPIFSMNSFGDFLKYGDYLELLVNRSERALFELHETEKRLEEARQEQAAVVDAAQARADEADAALAQVQDARSEAQAAAQAQARLQAERLGGKIAPRKSDLGERKRAAKEAASGQDEGGNAKQGAKGKGTGSKIDFSLPPTSSTELVALASETSTIDDGVDWRADRDAFIAEWSARIDAYLAGSPLAGQGANFAASAWKWGVDPRWSPAISNTESSKGERCIRPHNAWGWGAADSDPYNLAAEWDSWEEAIDAHVKGLADGYGYTISISKAQKYCSSWSSWYNNTLEQMSQI